MNLDGGAVQAHMFDSDGQDLLFLQPGENPVQYARLAPAAHPCVDGMPVAEMFRQAAPFATVFHHIQQGVEKLQVGDFDIAALPRQAGLDTM